MKKCSICHREIKTGKYCESCKMKSEIIFGTEIKNVVNHINKINKKEENNASDKSNL